jgi:hypothetical protein
MYRYIALTIYGQTEFKIVFVAILSHLQIKVDKGLTGAIPTEIGLLTQLTYLDIGK